MSKGHAPPPGQLTEQRTHVFTAVTMAGLQHGENYHDDDAEDDKVEEDEDDEKMVMRTLMMMMMISHHGRLRIIMISLMMTRIIMIKMIMRMSHQIITHNRGVTKNDHHLNHL